MGVGRSVFQTASLGKAYAAFSIVIPSPPTRGQAVAGIQNVELTKPVFPCQSSILTGLDSRLRGNDGNTGSCLLSGFPCSSL
ncbi:hypothetical protein E4K39_02260 [Neisseria meningitidis]|nr:hypothetical protein A6J53_13905 [Neisseria meningitidis]MBG8584416.1 hypothetical protein [Neisseria meningitidis]MBG8586604.1 hypothetical protein [Neisseria meningitidis]MBG8590845.1 hypothetical protein [Neisseria meningitidis]MBG8597837.1 hypothetical protein [Neisseria meningitidis]